MSVKQNVIALLEENRSKVISGQELANQLYVSRAAIWKAIKTLKEEGYNIEATPNKGYVLLENSDVLSKQGIAYYLTEEIDIFSYKTIDSTNTQMKKLAINGGKNHSVIVSEEQSAGRGRFGRSFYSPAQKGVYMSVLLKTGDSLQNATMITIKTADRTYSMCGSLKKLEEELTPYQFIRVHKSFLVNMKQINVIHNDKIILTDNSSVLLSKSRRAEVRKLYFRGGA